MFRFCSLPHKCFAQHDNKLPISMRQLLPTKMCSSLEINQSNLQHLQVTTVRTQGKARCQTVNGRVPKALVKTYLGVFRRYSHTPFCSCCHSSVYHTTQRSLHQHDHLVLLYSSYYTLRHYRVYHHSKQIGFHCVGHWAQSSNADSKPLKIC